MLVETVRAETQTVGLVMQATGTLEPWQHVLVTRGSARIVRRVGSHDRGTRSSGDSLQIGQSVDVDGTLVKINSTELHFRFSGNTLPLLALGNVLLVVRQVEVGIGLPPGVSSRIAGDGGHM